MKTFDVYKHPTLGYEAVKRGFSWPAFFFEGIWALSKRMWVGGAVLVVVWFGLVGGQTNADAKGESGASLFLALVGLVLGVAVGMLGNGRWAESLRRRGYEHVGTASAEEPEGAIAGFAKKSDTAEAK